MGFDLLLLPDATGRKSTALKVKKKAVYLPRRRIVYTNSVNLKGFVDNGLPITVVPFGGKYYICDGNHRFFSRGRGGKWAVILLPEDRDKIDRRQKSIPHWIDQWACGEISYDDMVEGFVASGKEAQ